MNSTLPYVTDVKYTSDIQSFNQWMSLNNRWQVKLKKKKILSGAWWLGDWPIVEPNLKLENNLILTFNVALLSSSKFHGAEILFLKTTSKFSA